MGTPGQEVRRLIRAARDRKEWTQADLARAARVSRGTVQNLENGMALREGKESRIEAALDLPVGMIEAVRSGRTSVDQAIGRTAATDHQPVPQHVLQALEDELEYFRIRLGADDFFLRLMPLIEAMTQERMRIERERERSNQDIADSDRLDETG